MSEPNAAPNFYIGATADEKYTRARRIPYGSPDPGVAREAATKAIHLLRAAVGVHKTAEHVAQVLDRLV